MTLKTGRKNSSCKIHQPNHTCCNPFRYVDLVIPFLSVCSLNWRRKDNEKTFNGPQVFKRYSAFKIQNSKVFERYSIQKILMSKVFSWVWLEKFNWKQKQRKTKHSAVFCALQDLARFLTLPPIWFPKGEEICETFMKGPRGLATARARDPGCLRAGFGPCGPVSREVCDSGLSSFSDF